MKINGSNFRSGLDEHIAENAREGDVVIVMSSGAFGGVYEKILGALKG